MTDEVSLREHLEALLAEKDKRDEQRFEAQKEATTLALQAAEKAVTAALASQEKAVTKAEMAANDRAEAANGLRALLSDQAQTFIPRVEFSALANIVTALTARMDRNEGSSKGSKDFYGYVAGGLGLLVAVAAVVIAFVK